MEELDTHLWQKSRKMHGLWGLVEMVNVLSTKKDEFWPKLE